MDLAGCLADGTPDAWGRRVILRRLHAGDTRDLDTTALPTVTYLLESDTDRIGANDVQASAETYVPREIDATLEELLTAADRLQAGEPFREPIDRVLNAGSSVGGARPKVTVTVNGGGPALIAKLSTPTDTYPVVKGEAVAMELARRAGLNVAATERVTVLDRDVLLVDRFDRTPCTHRRRAMVSALTLLGLAEMQARYATYPDLVQTVIDAFEDAADTVGLTDLDRRLLWRRAFLHPYAFEGYGPAPA